MSTHNPIRSDLYFPCHPEQFAVFRRGDKALCLKDCGKNDWMGDAPKGGKVYIVRDFHFGSVECLGHGVAYGQILNLEGIICDRVAHVGNVEYGFYYAGFRKVTDQEAEEIAHAQNTVEAQS